MRRPRPPRGCGANGKKIIIICGRDSVVGIVTRYGLEGVGIESRCGRGFTCPLRPALGPIQPPVQWVVGLFPWDKAAGVVPITPPHSTVEVANGLELYPVSPLCLQKHVMRCHYYYYHHHLYHYHHRHTLSYSVSLALS